MKTKKRVKKLERWVAELEARLQIHLDLHAQAYAKDKLPKHVVIDDDGEVD